ncbi:hypothetical protein LTR10_015591 [Elasticomyces elasticus]|uniref:Uncharacterized protein n=1 Tax=Exophiala sideris TaxID=1016849 RepID=A0ABR0JL11_9EURO|nr:hypothetical protein LTR10_015591 [Elasticomyces elasticus]KAK5032303.1 hypothetical protein LTR13_007521 [Exophiala sideris]KAK5036301.1 hypothetical protein LTS07_002027 [Exophiala sideris]KAK5066684.1 hypothetical protein LTR69_002031 [Exophiala sideris]KAK5180506.1 hypothetical protein LTR44_007264 [Eurotiomycetes sp. CCFEE 6388]
MAVATQLSKNDSSVLSAILNPEAGLGDNFAAIIQTSAVNSGESHIAYTIRQQEKHILLSLNTESPSRSDIEDAISAFGNLLDKFPGYASGYANRAQARRLLYPDLATLAEHPEDVDAMFDDLEKAISLASPQNSIQAVSSEAASVLSSAHTHRAYLLYEASQKLGLGNKMLALSHFAKFDSQTLSELASRDFALGGRYGNKVAKQLAVHTNPYAKLCGSIVKEALQKEIESIAEGTMSR